MRAAAAVMGLALILGACGQDAEQQAESNGSVAAGGGGDAGKDGAALWAGGAKRPLEIQSAHPNGVVLQLTSLQSGQTETTIGLRVINGRDKAIDLNRFNSSRNGYLALDTGEKLYLSPPANNTRLSIEAGQTLEGQLVFLGRLPKAQSAVLVLNENGQADSEYSNTPAFRINLPLATLEGGQG